MFLKVTKWKLLGFILSDHVIWKKHFAIIDGSSLSDIDDSGRYFEYLEARTREFAMLGMVMGMLKKFRG